MSFLGIVVTVCVVCALGCMVIALQAWMETRRWM
jgi:hypothetical protein